MMQVIEKVNLLSDDNLDDDNDNHDNAVDGNAMAVIGNMAVSMRKIEGSAVTTVVEEKVQRVA